MRSWTLPLRKAAFLALFLAALAPLAALSPLAPLAAAWSDAEAADDTPPPDAVSILVLPFGSVGVSDTTVRVAHGILLDELTARGLRVVPAGSLSGLPAGPEACDDPSCAAAAGERHGAGRVVYGRLSRLGAKVLVRLSAVRPGESRPDFSDQLAASTEEDLDTVLRRFADAIARGHGDAAHATVQTVLEEEAREPRLRATRSGIGFQAGFLFPDGGSYAGEDRLTKLHLAYRYERPTFLVETTTALGFAFASGTVDWTVLDVAVARVFGSSDLAPYLGAGVGVHSVHVEQEPRRVWNEPYQYWSYEYKGVDDSATAPTIDLVAGLLAMRTFDFELIAEARYHYMFEDFDGAGGDGAHGFQICIGTGR